MQFNISSYLIIFKTSTRVECLKMKRINSNFINKEFMRVKLNKAIEKEKKIVC